MNKRIINGKEVFLINDGEIPKCPKCNSKMIYRTAHQNSFHAKSNFWGCSKYPECKGIVEIVKRR